MLGVLERHVHVGQTRRQGRVDVEKHRIVALEVCRRDLVRRVRLDVDAADFLLGRAAYVVEVAVGVLGVLAFVGVGRPAAAEAAGQHALAHGDEVRAFGLGKLHARGLLAHLDLAFRAVGRGIGVGQHVVAVDELDRRAYGMARVGKHRRNGTVAFRLLARALVVLLVVGAHGHARAVGRFRELLWVGVGVGAIVLQFRARDAVGAADLPHQLGAVGRRHEYGVVGVGHGGVGRLAVFVEGRKFFFLVAHLVGIELPGVVLGRNDIAGGVFHYDVGILGQMPRPIELVAAGKRNRAIGEVHVTYAIEHRRGARVIADTDDRGRVGLLRIGLLDGAFLRD